MTQVQAFAALARLVARGAGLGRPLPLADPDPDPATLLGLAQRHRVILLMERGWRDLAARGEAGPVPDLIVAAARQEHGRALATAAALARLARGLDEAGVKWLALKGPALAHQLYHDVTPRTARDLDILVDPHDLVPAVEVARRLGWTIADDWQRLAQLSGKYDLELAPAKPGLPPLEIHTRLGHGDMFAPRIDTVSAPHRVAIAGYAVPVLTGPDLLVYVAWHGARHFWFRLNWLVDLAGLLTATCDGQAVVSTSRAWGAERSVRAGSLLAERLLGIDAPALPAPSGTMMRNVARLVGWAETRLRIDPDHDHVVRRPMSFLWTIRETRSDDAGWRGLLPLAKRLWLPRECDARQVGVGAPLAVHLVARLPLLLNRLVRDVAATAWARRR
ncbi:nucleotidyltransferase family protein [Sphingomonas sp.]|uniref:nucleotidyltransferase family protein n=1 Tax=Sphingomonas sp. TaxID=28214 RepID=UPI003B3A7895